MKTSDRSVSLIMEEAAEWVLKWEQDSRQVDAREFSNWLARSPEHLREFLIGVGVHRNIRTLGAQQRAALANQDIGPTNRPHSLRVPLSGWWREARLGWGGTAAVIAAAAVLVLGIFLVPIAKRYQPLVAFTGEVRRFNLADGSLIHLKGWSRAYADVRGADRKVELAHGEAFFDVEHDAVHPFTVNVANATVRAVGTQFDVNLVAALLTVTVKAGSVELQPACGALPAVTLAAGQQAIVARDRCELTRPVLAPGELDRQLAWSHPVFKFENTRLYAAVEQLNRYNRRHLLIRDPSIGPVLYSGPVDSADIDDFVKTLRHLGVRSILQPGARGGAGDIILVGAQCPWDGVRCTNE